MEVRRKIDVDTLILEENLEITGYRDTQAGQLFSQLLVDWMIVKAVAGTSKIMIPLMMKATPTCISL